MHKLLSRVLWLCPLSLLPSCSASYEVQFEVSIGEGIDIPGEAQLGFVLHEHGEGTVDSGGRVAGMPAKAGVAVYKQKSHACCAPNPSVLLFAYLDNNANGIHDEGEPWGADPGNPVKLTDTKNAYVSKIVIGSGI